MAIPQIPELTMNSSTTYTTEQLEGLLELIATVDDQLEDAILYKWPVDKTLALLLPHAFEALEASGVFVRTLDERAVPVDLRAPQNPPLTTLALTPEQLDALYTRVEEEGVWSQRLDAETLVLGYRLDVSTISLGAVLVFYRGEPSHPTPYLERRLQCWSEALDNYLAAVADARHKHIALQQISDALRTPILDDGIDQALRILSTYLPFQDLILTFQHDTPLELHTINYRVLIDQKDVLSSASRAVELDGALEDSVLATFRGENSALTERFSLATPRTSIDILDAHDRQIVGHISLHAAPEALTPFSLDLLDRFADYLRQRIVDFNKEWKHLSRNFPLGTVRALLRHERYHETFLSPQEHDVAIMYCDISGFTKLSEQILREPALIGKLINIWSSQVVEFIWQSGGVFDKMVGDCIIGLWGPPFHDRTPEQECLAALEAARQIQAYTRALPSHPDLPELHGADIDIGVATGLNYCSLFVGTFGPDDNFTGFSSGMNNTARLQGVATRDEILAMDSFVEVLGQPERFGPPQQAQVKNVAAPLVYHAFEQKRETGR